MSRTDNQFGSRRGGGGGGGARGPPIVVAHSDRWEKFVDSRNAAPEVRQEKLRQQEEAEEVERELLQSMFENAVTPGINFDLYDAVPVEITGQDAPEQISTFKDIDLGDALNFNIKLAKYTKPTPVQKGAIPAIIKGIFSALAC